MTIPPCTKGWHNADPESHWRHRRAFFFFPYSSWYFHWDGKGIVDWCFGVID